MLDLFKRFFSKRMTTENPSKSVLPNSDTLKLEYVNTAYKVVDEKILFLRIVRENDEQKEIKGEIAFDNELNTEQIITSVKRLDKEAISSFEEVRRQLNFTDKFDGKVLFLQINHNCGDDLDAMYKLRDRIETKLSRYLHKQLLGSQFASDFGPGGINLLFDVLNWDKLLITIFNCLNDLLLLEDCLVAKRLKTEEEDWNYEVVYPLEFSGTFNQM